MIFGKITGVSKLLNWPGWDNYSAIYNTRKKKMMRSKLIWGHQFNPIITLRDPKHAYSILSCVQGDKMNKKWKKNSFSQIFCQWFNQKISIGLKCRRNIQIFSWYTSSHIWHSALTEIWWSDFNLHKTISLRCSELAFCASSILFTLCICFNTVCLRACCALAITSSLLCSIRPSVKPTISWGSHGSNTPTPIGWAHRMPPASDSNTLLKYPQSVWPTRKNSQL